ncbi:MAG: hypothetical protein ACK4K0_11960 [Flavobacteriales bacterium]
MQKTKKIVFTGVMFFLMINLSAQNISNEVVYYNKTQCEIEIGVDKINELQIDDNFEKWKERILAQNKHIRDMKFESPVLTLVFVNADDREIHMNIISNVLKRIEKNFENINLIEN